MRLFIAINFDEEIKQNLVTHIHQLQSSYPDLKWIKKPALHLTLKFLGEIPLSLSENIKKKLSTAFLNIGPFDLQTTLPGFFPNSRQPRVYFLGLKQSPTLNECYNILENELFSVGIEKERRRFSPHITLARIKHQLDQQTISTLLGHNYPLIDMPVNDIVLMSSTLFPSGARYTVVQCFSLRTI